MVGLAALDDGAAVDGPIHSIPGQVAAAGASTTAGLVRHLEVRGAVGGGWRRIRAWETTIAPPPAIVKAACPTLSRTWRWRCGENGVAVMRGPTCRSRTAAVPKVAKYSTAPARRRLHPLRRVGAKAGPGRLDASPGTRRCRVARFQAIAAEDPQRSSCSYAGTMGMLGKVHGPRFFNRWARS
jgi:hypothetical protein